MFSQPCPKGSFGEFEQTLIIAKFHEEVIYFLTCKLRSGMQCFPLENIAMATYANTEISRQQQGVICLPNNIDDNIVKYLLLLTNSCCPAVCWLKNKSASNGKENERITQNKKNVMWKGKKDNSTLQPPSRNFIDCSHCLTNW